MILQKQMYKIIKKRFINYNKYHKQLIYNQYYISFKYIFENKEKQNYYFYSRYIKYSNRNLCIKT